MSDIKGVLAELCQHLNYSINVTMKPEYFRLAKFNGNAENLIELFWKALNVLSYYAVKEKEIELDFEHCDMVSATKLYFVYLQYPAVEFYASSLQSKNTRILLLAFAWLLGTQNVLNIVIRRNLTRSVVGREFSYMKEPNEEKIEYSIPESIPAQIDNILYLNGKVNYNIKEISELIAEQIKLVTKIHAASINVSGLPHLSTSELALIKRITTINKKAPSSGDKKYIKELSTIANLLDVHVKWLKKGHIFFEWMVTVVEEHNKSLNNSIEDVDWNEVSKFISLLHSVTQERLETISSKVESKNFQDKLKCPTRLLKAQGDGTEIEKWLPEISSNLNNETSDLIKIKEKLSEKLKEILQSIPSCVQVSF